MNKYKFIEDILYNRKISYKELSLITNKSISNLQNIIHRNFKKAKKFNESIGKSSFIKLDLTICKNCNILIKKDKLRDKGRRLCNKCDNKRQLNYKNTGKYYIYYIPEEHYIGISNKPQQRMYSHKKTKIIDGWEIVAEYNDPKLAALHEALLHYIGYRGSAYDRMLKGHAKKRKYNKAKPHVDRLKKILK